MTLYFVDPSSSLSWCTYVETQMHVLHGYFKNLESTLKIRKKNRSYQDQIYTHVSETYHKQIHVT